MPLPNEKKDKLANDLSKQIQTETKKFYKNLREHEVSKEDSKDVIKRAWKTTKVPEDLDD